MTELRAGVAASGGEAEQVVTGLDFLLTNRMCLAKGAEGFSAKYRGFDANEQVRRLVEGLDALLFS